MPTVGPVRSSGGESPSLVSSPSFVENTKVGRLPSPVTSPVFLNSGRYSATSPSTSTSSSTVEEGGCKRDEKFRLLSYESPCGMSKDGSAVTLRGAGPSALLDKGGEVPCRGEDKRGSDREEEERAGIREGRNTRSSTLSLTTCDGAPRTGHTSTSQCSSSSSSNSENGSLRSDDSWDSSPAAVVDPVARQSRRSDSGGVSGGFGHLGEGVSSCVRESAAALLAKFLLSGKGFDALKSTNFKGADSDDHDRKKLELVKNTASIHYAGEQQSDESEGVPGRSFSQGSSEQQSLLEGDSSDTVVNNGGGLSRNLSSTSRELLGNGVAGGLRGQRMANRSERSRNSSVMVTRKDSSPLQCASPQYNRSDSFENRALFSQSGCCTGMGITTRGGGPVLSAEESYAGSPMDPSSPDHRGISSYSSRHDASSAYLSARGGGGGGDVSGSDLVAPCKENCRSKSTAEREDRAHRSGSGSEHGEFLPSPSSWSDLPGFIAAFYEAEERGGRQAMPRQNKKGSAARGGERGQEEDVKNGMLPKRSTSSLQRDISPDPTPLLSRKKRKVLDPEDQEQQPAQTGPERNRNPHHQYTDEERAAVNQFIVGGAMEACGALMKTESPTWMPPFTLHDSHRLVYELIDEFGKRRTNFSILVPKVLRLIRIFLQHAQAGKWDEPEAPAPLPTCAAFNDVGQTKTVKRLEQCFPFFASQGGLLLCTQGRRLESGGGGKYYFQDRRGRVVGCHKHDLSQYTSQGCVSSPVLLKTLLFCLVLKPRYLAGVDPNHAALSPVSTATTATSSTSTGSQALAGLGGGLLLNRSHSSSVEGVGPHYSFSLSPGPVTPPTKRSASGDIDSQARSLHQSNSCDDGDASDTRQGEGRGSGREREFPMLEAAGEADLWEAVTDVEKLVGQTERLISFPETAKAISQAEGSDFGVGNCPFSSASLNKNADSMVHDYPGTGAMSSDVLEGTGGRGGSFCMATPCCGGTEEEVATTCVRSSNPQRLVRVYRSLVEEQKTHVVERLLRVWSMTLHVHTGNESSGSHKGLSGGGRQGKQRQGGGDADLSDFDQNDDSFKDGTAANGPCRKRLLRTGGVKCRTGQQIEPSKLLHEGSPEKKCGGIGWRPCVSLLWVKPLPLAQSMLKWSRRSTASVDADIDGLGMDDEQMPLELNDLLYAQKGGDGYGIDASLASSQKIDLLPRHVTSCASTHLPSDPSSVDYSPTLLSPQSCGREVSPGERLSGEALAEQVGREEDLRAWVVRHLEAGVRGRNSGAGGGGDQGVTSKAVAELHACLEGGAARSSESPTECDQGERGTLDDRWRGGFPEVMNREVRLTAESEGQNGGEPSSALRSDGAKGVGGTRGTQGGGSHISDKSRFSSVDSSGCGGEPAVAMSFSESQAKRATYLNEEPGPLGQAGAEKTRHSGESRSDSGEMTDSELVQDGRTGGSAVQRSQVVQQERTTTTTTTESPQLESPDVQETCGKLKSLLAHPGGSEVFQAVRTLVEAALAHNGGAGGFGVSSEAGDTRALTAGDTLLKTGGEMTASQSTGGVGGKIALGESSSPSYSPQTAPSRRLHQTPLSTHRANCSSPAKSSGQSRGYTPKVPIPSKETENNAVVGHSPGVTIDTEGEVSGGGEAHDGKVEGFSPVILSALETLRVPADGTEKESSFPHVSEQSGERGVGSSQVKRLSSEAGFVVPSKNVKGGHRTSITRVSRVNGKEGADVERHDSQSEEVFEELKDQLESQLGLHKRPVSRQQLEMLLMHMLRVEEPEKVSG
ncbi:hypothetical protein CSUI_005308 [Cystoisospora suis]|uniref:Uncharacterized protein n=1 Tax=Cystoisospora suis TaxID=483139 RepID=A0A2C6KVN4_9APIC|nr:hypothetical protein CSUI_005308 [Cystoisospora suis]